MGSIEWDENIADIYDTIYTAKFDEAVLHPMVDLLADLAGEGTALEFAVGTGESRSRSASAGSP